MLDEAFVIENGSERRAFYRTWSRRRNTKVSEGGVTGSSTANKKPYTVFGHSDDSAARETEASAISIMEQEQIACNSGQQAVRCSGYRAIGWLIP